MISRHSVSELAFQTEWANQGRMVATSHQIAASDRMVRMLFSQLENRFSRAQRTAPICELGGASAGSIWSRT